jgi:hypothetical protein
MSANKKCQDGMKIGEVYYSCGLPIGHREGHEGTPPPLASGELSGSVRQALEYADVNDEWAVNALAYEVRRLMAGCACTEGKLCVHRAAGASFSSVAACAGCAAKDEALRAWQKWYQREFPNVVAVPLDHPLFVGKAALSQPTPAAAECPCQSLGGGHDGCEDCCAKKRAAAEREAVRWQSMESAPKDGQEFLIRYPKQGNVIALCRWNKVWSNWQSKGEMIYPEEHECQWWSLDAALAQESRRGE